MSAAWRILVLAIALCIGAIAIFWRLTDASPFLDEGFTLWVGGQPVPQLLALVASSDNSPPLFHLYTHALGWLHLHAWDYRWFCAPFGLVTIAASWGVAQRLFGDRAAAVAALLTATSPLLVDWDRMYRMYAPFVALSVLSWWLLVLVAERTQTKPPMWLAIAYVVIAACVPLLHYAGLLVVASQAAYAFARRRTAWLALGACALAAAGLLAWLPGMREQFARGGSLVLSNQVYWLGAARNLFAPYLPTAAAQTRPTFDWLITALALWIVAAALWIWRRTALPFMVAPAIVQAAASALLGKDFVNPRYLLYVQPIFAVCTGAITAAQRTRFFGLAVAFAVLACNVVGLQNLLLDPYYQRSDWYAVSALLVTQEHAGDAIVLDQGYMHYVVDDLNGFRGHATFRVDSSESVRAFDAWLRARPTSRVWYVENQFYYPDPQRAVFTTLRAHRLALGTYEQKRRSPADAVAVVLFGPAER